MQYWTVRDLAYEPQHVKGTLVFRRELSFLEIHENGQCNLAQCIFIQDSSEGDGRKFKVFLCVAVWSILLWYWVWFSQKRHTVTLYPFHVLADPFLIQSASTTGLFDAHKNLNVRKHDIYLLGRRCLMVHGMHSFVSEPSFTMMIHNRHANIVAKLAMAASYLNLFMGELEKKMLWPALMKTVY